MDKIKLRVIFEKYGGWIIINIGGCLLPILFTMVITKVNKPELFSSFLCVAFTLLIISIYNYHCENEPVIFNDLLYSISLILLCMLTVYYPTYNLDKDIKIFASSNLLLIFIGIFLIVTVFSLFLNNKGISDRVNRITALRKEANAEKIKKTLDEAKKILEAEGHS